MDIHWDTSQSIPSAKNYCWDDCTSVFLTYLCDWNPWLWVWNFWLLQCCSWDMVSSGLHCHVTGWLVLSVSRPLCCQWNVRHQSHSDLAPYARRTKTWTLRYFLEGLKHVDILCEWSELGGGWSNMEHSRLFFLSNLSHWGMDIYEHVTPVEHAWIFILWQCTAVVLCHNGNIWSWLTAYWFCMVDYVSGIASI